MSAMFHKFMISTALIFMLIGAVACAPQSQEVAELPTLFILPSLTPSHTPTDTPPPTATPLATSTPLPPTATFTVSPTNTPTATRTSTPTVALATTIAPLAATNTPQFTSTPTATPTGTGLQIISFTASTPTAPIGSSVILRWEAVGDSARIDELNAQGIVLRQQPVPLAGEQAFIIPNIAGASIIYRLTVVRGTQERSEIVSIALTAVTCPTPWFFPNPPPALGCPTGPAETGPGAFQPFEQGVMIYVNVNNRNVIYALANQGAAGGFVQQNLYGQSTSLWDGVTNHCTETPPPGFLAPQNQFNWMACTVFGPAGFWRNTIGWATAPIDTSNRTIQFGQNGIFVIDSPAGVLYRFEPILPGQNQNVWARLN